MVYKKAQINHERFQNPKVIQQTDSVLKNKKNMQIDKSTIKIIIILTATRLQKLNMLRSRPIKYIKLTLLISFTT